MSKDDEFLDLNSLDMSVKDKTDPMALPQQGVASPATRMVKQDSKPKRLLDRTMKKREEKSLLEREVQSLKLQLEQNNETISLKMPISKLDVKFKKQLVEPEFIDISPENQRIQSLLDMSAVADIYESILTEGQSEPGFLRKKENNRYELISGSRRHFCVKQIPGRQYLAFVGDVPDVDIRRLSRLENQQAPISAYERARSFKFDVENKKYKSWEALAAIEGLSDRQIWKYKALSGLPIEIVKSFGSPADLSLVFADWLTGKTSKDSFAKTKVLALAEQLNEQKAEVMEKGAPVKSANEVMAIYKSALRIKAAKPTAKKPLVYELQKGEGKMKHTISSSGSHKLEFVNIPEDRLEKLIDSIKSQLGVGG